MLVVDIIRAKRRGQPVDPNDLRELVAAYTRDDVPDYQMSAFLMAVLFQGMRPEELAAWTDAMLHSGQVLDLSEIEGAKVDKHSTGGVGDKVSLILAPLAVAAGIKVPMISGRGLGHTGGTLDKLESIPGFDVRVSTDEFRTLVRDVGAGLIGQTGQVAPADKRLYALRDVTATVECIPLIASSIMSKKLAEGIDALVLDVKVGNGAFMKTLEDARVLGRTMIEIGARMNRPVTALLTDMSQPLGFEVGNANEVVESIATLKGEGPEDLEDLTVALVAEMMALAGLESDREAAGVRLRAALRDGSALDHFARMIEAQGGDPRVLDDPSLLPQAPERVEVLATQDGFVTGFDTTEVGQAGVELGAGRKKKEDDVDHAVGITIHKKRGEAVAKGEPLATIHYRDVRAMEACRARLEPAIHVGEQAGESVPLIFERLE